MYALIPNVEQFETHLERFRAICEADEVVLFERATFLVISHTSGRPKQPMDPHRFEKISNIIKQFKLSCSKMQAQFKALQVRNSHYAAYMDTLTANTYVMVVISDPAIRTSFNLLARMWRILKVNARCCYRTSCRSAQYSDCTGLFREARKQEHIKVKQSEPCFFTKNGGTTNIVYYCRETISFEYEYKNRMGQGAKERPQADSLPSIKHESRISGCYLERNPFITGIDQVERPSVELDYIVVVDKDHARRSSSVLRTTDSGGVRDATFNLWT